MLRCNFFTALPLLSIWAFQVSHIVSAEIGTRKMGEECTATIQSLDDVAAAQDCTAIVINGFIVPPGQTFMLQPPDNAIVTLKGDLNFSVMNWEGPLMVLKGNNISFDGGNHRIIGNGDQYWDGQGINGGVTKPDPTLRINISGKFKNLQVLNSPGRGVAIGGGSNGNLPGLVVEGVFVNNAAGAAPNDRSNGKPAGSNTDGFDVSTNNLIIQNSRVINQDDCLAINRGTNITFQNNSCKGGHGISVGSISSNVTVQDVLIRNNRVIDNVQALRIKTKVDSVSSFVTNITYIDNFAITHNNSKNQQFGLLIDQSYPSILSVPGDGVVISGIKFLGRNVIRLPPKAKDGNETDVLPTRKVDVNCGSLSSCAGTWDFSGLVVTGGVEGAIVNATIKGGRF